MSGTISFDENTCAAMVEQLRAYLEASQAERLRALETSLLTQGFDADAIDTTLAIFAEEDVAAIEQALADADALFAKGAP